MEEAFLPTLQTLFSAPVSSPLASVNVNNAAELLVQLTNSKYLAKQGNSIDNTEVLSKTQLNQYLTIDRCCTVFINGSILSLYKVLSSSVYHV